MGWWGKQINVDSFGEAKPVQLGSPWRLQTIYRANKQSAYNVGRWKQQMENSDQRPYWQYIAVLDSRTRPSHAALHRRVFRFDDPIWASHYPPNGFGCRCRVRALSEAALKRRKLRVESSDGRLEPVIQQYGTDAYTGEVIRRQATAWTYELNGEQRQFTPDPGWSYNPGRAGYNTDIDMMRKISAVDDRQIRAQAVQAFNSADERHQAYALWAESVIDGRPGFDAQVVGLVDEALADQVRQRGNQAPARVMTLGARQLAGPGGAGRPQAATAVSRGEMLNLPRMITNPQAVLWDRADQELLYVYPSDDDAWMVVVSAPYRRNSRGAPDVGIDAFRMPVDSLRDPGYELLRGRLD